MNLLLHAIKFSSPIKKLTLFLQKGGLIQTRPSKGLDLTLQSFNCFLVLSNGPFQLKVFIEVSQTPNQNSQHDRAEDHQKKGNFRYLEKLIICNRGEAKPNDNLLRVLQEEKDADDQDYQ